VEYFDSDALFGDVLATTIGANVRVAANLMIRPELRYEDFSSSFAGHDQLLFAIDAVMTF
jgi:hypothetical protein